MSEIQTYKFYAGNRWHEPSSEKYFESEDPSIGKVWACLLYTSPSPRDT